MRNYFTFGNYDSRDFGVFIARDGVYNSPKQVVKAVQVPGRNGDIIISQNRMENIDLTYPACIYSGFDANLTGLKNALLSNDGYVRITDSYHPDEYRLGYYEGAMTVIPTVLGDGGTFSVTFRCKPQRFLTSGEQSVEYTAAGTITNPTQFPSKPLIRVYGYGTLTVGHDSITIASGYSYVDIDSDIQDCYYGIVNANSKVTFHSNDFPELSPGDTGIAFSGNITKVVITPRWYQV